MIDGSEAAGPAERLFASIKQYDEHTRHHNESKSLLTQVDSPQCPMRVAGCVQGDGLTPGQLFAHMKCVGARNQDWCR